MSPWFYCKPRLHFLPNFFLLIFRCCIPSALPDAFTIDPYQPIINSHFAPPTPPPLWIEPAVPRKLSPLCLMGYVSCNHHHNKQFLARIGLKHRDGLSVRLQPLCPPRAIVWLRFCDFYSSFICDRATSLRTKSTNLFSSCAPFNPLMLSAICCWFSLENLIISSKNIVRQAILSVLLNLQDFEAQTLIGTQFTNP